MEADAATVNVSNIKQRIYMKEVIGGCLKENEHQMDHQGY